jgi:hypothetical protein
VSAAFAALSAAIRTSLEAAAAAPKLLPVPRLEGETDEEYMVRTIPIAEQITAELLQASQAGMGAIFAQFGEALAIEQAAGPPEPPLTPGQTPQQERDNARWEEALSSLARIAERCPNTWIEVITAFDGDALQLIRQSGPSNGELENAAWLLRQLGKAIVAREPGSSPQRARALAHLREVFARNAPSALDRASALAAVGTLGDVLLFDRALELAVCVFA